MIASFRLLLPGLSLLLALGCSSNTPREQEQAAAGQRPEQPSAETLMTPPVPERPIPPDSVYPLLRAEFALRRADYHQALDIYLEQARLLADVGVARHATLLAQFVRDDEAALEAVQLLLALDPDDPDAVRIASNLLARQQRPLEALPYMARLTQQGQQANYPSLLQGFKRLTPQQQATLVAELNTLAADYPDDPALLLTQALVHAEFAQLPQALATLERLFTVEPFQFQGLLLEARILRQTNAPEPLARIEAALAENPDDTRLRLEYARFLTDTDLDAARGQFEVLSAQAPRDADLLLSLALINREMGDPLVARAYLRQMLELGERTDDARYYLGRIAEDRGEQALALEHYQQVADGRQYLPASQRIGQLLIAGQQLEAAQQWYAGQRLQLPLRAEQLYALEADLLGSNGFPQAAMQRLGEGLAAFPDAVNLRYARSIVAEQLDMLPLVESDLRAIIAAEPDNATALNALGYTLANRTQRLDEAYQLISQALALEPDEPAILDSMGWVLYRKGEYQQALDYLTRAYAAFPDPEVAAHLGEVLWVTGDTARATQVWQGALLRDPSHEVLLGTLRRLGAQELMTTPAAPPEARP